MKGGKCNGPRRVSEFGWSNPIRWVDDGQRMKKTFLRCAVSSSRAVASRDCDHKCTVHISISFWDTSAHCFSRLSLMNEATAAKRAAGLKTWRTHCWGHVRPHTNSRSTWRARACRMEWKEMIEERSKRQKKKQSKKRDWFGWNKEAMAPPTPPFPPARNNNTQRVLLSALSLLIQSTSSYQRRRRSPPWND